MDVVKYAFCYVTLLPLSLYSNCGLVQSVLSDITHISHMISTHH